MSTSNPVLAVVPARSGSKGIPDKNMQVIDGLSLIGRAARVLRECPGVDHAILSTDSERYAAEGKAHGLDIPFLRPPELSTDTAGAVETLTHALLAAEAHYGNSFGVVLIVEPTCPLRRAEDVEGALKQLLESGADSVVTVSRVDTKFHPDKLLTLDHGKLGFYSAAGAGVKARQQLAPLYYRNGACYALTRDCLVNQKAIFGRDTRAYVIDRQIVNIDEPAELELARFLMNRESGDR